MLHLIALLLSPALCFAEDAGYHGMLPPDSRPAMVLGESAEAESFSLADYYRKSGYPHLVLWTDVDVRDEALLGRPLVLVGSPSDNAILGRVTDRLPAAITEKGFSFGGKEYGPEAGLVAVLQSPFDAGQRAVVHTGAGKEGWLSTFSVPTPAAEYALTVKGRVLRRGFFTPESDPPVPDPARDEDLEALRDSRRATRISSASARIDYEFLPVHAERIPALVAEDGATYARLGDFFGAAPRKRIRYKLYASVLEKEAHTGLRANAHSDVKSAEVHAVLAPGLDATGPHELVHLFAEAGWGKSGSRVMEEGAAVGLTGDWWSEPLDVWAGRLHAKSQVPALAVLAGDPAYWKANEDIAYPLSGHLFLHLVRQYGKERVRVLYGKPFDEAAAQAALGVPWKTVEERWRADVALASGR